MCKPCRNQTGFSCTEFVLQACAQKLDLKVVEQDISHDKLKGRCHALFAGLDCNNDCMA